MKKTQKRIRQRKPKKLDFSNFNQIQVSISEEAKRKTTNFQFQETKSSQLLQTN